VNLDDMLIRVHPGDGLIARSTGIALVVFALDPSHSRVTDELLNLIEGSAGAGKAPGRRLARQVARLLGEADPDEVPSFGLLAQAEHGIVLILHGDADAEITRSGAGEHLSGRQVATWIDRILEPPVDALVIGPSGATLAPADSRFQLRGGAVPGGGLSLVAADAPDGQVPPVATPPRAEVPVEAPPPPAGPGRDLPPRADPPPDSPPRILPAPDPAPPAPPVPTVEAEEGSDDATMVDMGSPPAMSALDAPEQAPPASFVSVLFDDHEPEEVREALPVVGHDQSVAEALEPEGPQVKGVICSRGHFNDPSTPFCAICGISMVQKTLHLVDGRRPPLGVIVFDDGATFSVDTDYVLGREPEFDPDVVSGKARPLTLTDPERTVSRVHAALVLEDWNVRLVDRGSANGTYIAMPGRDDWSPVLANQPTTIKPGTKVRLGQRALLFDSHGGMR
jgi:hypothetical protein